MVSTPFRLLTKILGDKQKEYKFDNLLPRIEPVFRSQVFYPKQNTISYPQHIIEQIISWHGLHFVVKFVNNYSAPKAVIYYICGLIQRSSFDKLSTCL